VTVDTEVVMGVVVAVPAVVVDVVIVGATVYKVHILNK
jgi:hypothetical protein